LSGAGDHGDGAVVFVTAEGDDHAEFAVADAFAVNDEAAGEDAGVTGFQAGRL